MRTFALGCVLLSRALLAQTAGSLDPSFNPTDLGMGKGDGRTGVTRDLAVLTDGRFLAVGEWGPLINRYLADGTVDPTFAVPVFSFSAQVHCLEVQSDGKILLGGTFTTVSGVARARIARLLPDGALDTSFDPGSGFNGTVAAVIAQPDGKIVVGGAFTQFNALPQNRLVRLTGTGVLDGSFTVGAGFNTSSVKALALQTDGKMLVGHGANMFNGTSCDKLMRLTANGMPDGTFNGPGSGPGSYVNCIVVRDDGRVDIGGNFMTYNGSPAARMARVLANGTLDPSFVTGTGFDGEVLSLLAQPQGEVLVGGFFVTFNGIYRAYHARLSAIGSLVTSYEGACGLGIAVYAMASVSGGSSLVAGFFGAGFGNNRCRIERFSEAGVLDMAFDPGTGLNSGLAWKVIAQPDGKVIVSGMFNKFNGHRAVGLVRIDLNGQYDETFQTGFGAHPGCGVCLVVACMALQANGKILVGGIFPYFNGVPAPGLVRLNADGSIDPTFSVSGIIPSGTLGLTSIAVQSDGAVIISGEFQTIHGVARSRIARLLPDGGLDATFDPGTGLDGPAKVLKYQTNSRILLGGGFAAYNGTSSPQLVRLQLNGTRDAALNVGTGFVGTVADVEQTATGDYIVGGDFSNYNETARNHLVRLNSAGVLQTGFSTAMFPIKALSVAGTTYTYIVGGYGNYNGITRMDFFGSAVDASFQAATGNAMDMALVLNEGLPVVVGDVDLIIGSSRNRVFRLLPKEAAGLQLRPRVMLQGAYGTAGLMRDDLRAGGLLPQQEPYSSMGQVYVGGGQGATTTTSLLSATGNDAIVDWVLVELRHPTSSQWVRASRPGLLQRDGDIMAPDGGPLTIAGIPGLYRIAVRHRNHLAMMSAFSTNLTTALSTTMVLTGATSAFGTSGQVQVDTGQYGLWAGDDTGNGQLRYTGTGNDRDPILIAVGSTTPNNSVTNVYDRRDTNLDGVIKYTGTANDRDIILTNVGSTTPNNTRTHQLP